MKFHTPVYHDLQKVNELGLSEKEMADFSLMRLVRFLANPEDKRAAYEAGFELAVAGSIEDTALRENGPGGLRVPWEVLQRSTLVQGTDSLGGYTRPSDIQGLDPRLDNRPIVERAGATVLRGLKGNLPMPQVNAGASAYWVAENGATTESSPSFVSSLAQMSPKTIGSFIDCSRRLLNQNAVGLDAWMGSELTRTINLALDAAAINGNPDATATANEPRGILNTSGIGAVSGIATNGSAPTRAHLLELIAQTEQANGLTDSSAFVMNSQGYNKLASTETATGSGRFVLEGRDFLGYQIHRSQQVPANLTQGSSSNTSAALFGAWEHLLIGIWGAGPTILVDPIANASNGGMRVHVHLDADVHVRYPLAFSAVAAGWITT